MSRIEHKVRTTNRNQQQAENNQPRSWKSSQQTQFPSEQRVWGFSSVIFTLLCHHLWCCSNLCDVFCTSQRAVQNHCGALSGHVYCSVLLLFIINKLLLESVLSCQRFVFSQESCSWTSRICRSTNAVKAAFRWPLFHSLSPIGLFTVYI